MNESCEKLLHTLSITQIFMIFQYVSYLWNRFLIGVIRDFWVFSEISESCGVDRGRGIMLNLIILN